MNSDQASGAELPPSVSENIETIAEYYSRHEEHASLAQAVIEKVSLFLGSPWYVAGSLLFVFCWIAANLVAPDYGWRQIDEPPFFWLQGIIAVNAFVISTTVLIRQNRMARLAAHHAHLDLQINLRTEEKTSKIIALLEELRQQLPGGHVAPDAETQEMAKPADAKAVLSAIEREHEQR